MIRIQCWNLIGMEIKESQTSENRKATRNINNNDKSYHVVSAYPVPGIVLSSSPDSNIPTLQIGKLSPRQVR